ncbi:MAG TPA: hypothetical protein VGO70_11135 [Arsenicitalea sp.]|nr:hypothetical protein [Arsenicitalea sp.]
MVIVHQPGWQSLSDWHAIANTVGRIDPSIATFVVSAHIADDAAQHAASRPTLVFSPGPLGRFIPKRGKVYHGRPIHKFEQLRRLAEAGVRVPRTTLLRPDTKLDPAEWGEFVVVKPTDIASSSHGDGIGLMRTERVRYIAPEEYPPGHPGRAGPMVVQHFVDTGAQISSYRVLTLFGQPLYCMSVRSEAERAPLSGDNTAIEAISIASQSVTTSTKEFVYEADVIALAAAAYRAIPEAPLQGCDVVRDAVTRAVYVLELNPGGNTWHFSSSHNAENRVKNGSEVERLRHTHLDAFGSAAHVLAERTRSEAA